MKHLIIGWGRTGQAAAKFLKDNNKDFIIYDDKVEDPSIINNPADLPWDQIKIAILSPGVPTWDVLPPVITMCRQNGIPVFSDIDILYHHNSNKKFIGITGSQGKTTIHDFMTKFMENNNYSISSGGNNGVACLSLPTKDYFILETSMQQLLINQSTLYDIGIFNNFFDTHQEMGEYFFRLNLKKKLLLRGKNLNQKFIIGDFPKGITKYLDNYIKKEDIVVYSDNFHTQQDIIHNNYCYISFHGDHHTIDFSIDNIEGQWIFNDGYGFKLIAEENLGIATAFTIIMGHNQQDLLKILSNYRLVDHRLTLIQNKNNWQWFNGSKCTNTFALSSLIKYIEYYYPGFNYWILGGIVNSSLDPLLNLNKKDKFIAYGQDGKMIANYLIDHGYQCDYENDLQKSIMVIKNNIKEYSGGNVILAPACQSFDQFKDFEDRGSKFAQWVCSDI